MDKGYSEIIKLFNSGFNEVKPSILISTGKFPAACSEKEIYL